MQDNCAKVSFLIKYNFIKKETLAKVFSCEFRENFKNTFFAEYWQATAFVSKNFSLLFSIKIAYSNHGNKEILLG